MERVPCCGVPAARGSHFHPSICWPVNVQPHPAPCLGRNPLAHGGAPAPDLLPRLGKLAVQGYSMDPPLRQLQVGAPPWTRFPSLLQAILHLAGLRLPPPPPVACGLAPPLPIRTNASSRSSMLCAVDRGRRPGRAGGGGGVHRVAPRHRQPALAGARGRARPGPGQNPAHRPRCGVRMQAPWHRQCGAVAHVRLL